MVMALATVNNPVLARLARGDFRLPSVCHLLRLQDLPGAEQKIFLMQVFALIAGEYAPWLELENLENWLACLVSGNARGTRMAVSVALDENRQAQAASAAEIYANGTAIINYSVGRKDDDNYLEAIGAATRDIMQALKALQAQGTVINLVVKEHHLDSARAQAGFLAVGQVPLDGPTSLLRNDVKYLEIACGHPQELDDPARLQVALALTDPQTPRVLEGLDDEIHLWLLGEFDPSDPTIPLATTLRQLADAHAGERSIFRERDIQLDPGWQSLQKLADSLPPQATYRDALEASRLGAARFMGLA